MCYSIRWVSTPEGNQTGCPLGVLSTCKKPSLLIPGCTPNIMDASGVSAYAEISTYIPLLAETWKLFIFYQCSYLGNVPLSHPYLTSLARDTKIMWFVFFFFFLPGCQRSIGLSNGKAKVCSYSGWYYCSTCHVDDSFLIPARLVHNWDTSKYKVISIGVGWDQVSWMQCNKNRSNTAGQEIMYSKFIVFLQPHSSFPNLWLTYKSVISQQHLFRSAAATSCLCILV